MRAAIIEDYGDNDVVRLVDIERPRPAAGEVLVKVEAAGVNPIDWKIRNGAGRRLGLTLPIRLGGELVGTVEALGADVDDFAPGEAIFGMVPSGGFAEYAVAKATDVVRKPANLDAVEAAAIPLAGLTAWQALFDLAGLADGQRLLITNASGGVGSLAVQLAKAAGAHVTAMASGRNETFVRSLGADRFIDYTSTPFEEAASGMDVVFDTVGGDTFQRAFGTLKPGGVLVTAVAFPTDEAARFAVRVERAFTKPDAKQLASLRDRVEAGTLRPHVSTVLPLAEVKQALALSEGGRTRGKIVLRIAT